MKLDIVISGVGGQGSVLASRALAQVAMENGLEVRTSEAIGMAQRGGPVSSHIRMGQEVFGAIIPDHKADLLLGLELAETVRHFNKIKLGGTVIASTSTIIPVPVHLGISAYNTGTLTEYLQNHPGNVVFLDIPELTRQAGHPKTGNAVILGAMSAAPGLPFQPDQLLRSMLSFVPARFKDVNRQAFELGRLAMEAA